jgi:hypothetical protein
MQERQNGGQEMSLKIWFVKILHVVASIALIIQLTACGYFLYPERHGQKPLGALTQPLPLSMPWDCFYSLFPG